MNGASAGDAFLLKIQSKIGDRNYRLTSHAEAERESDKISIAELEEALLSPSCEVIEDYPDDPRGHSCLALGFAENGAAIHVVLGVGPGEDPLVVVTVYRPDQARWENWRTRRTP